MSDPLCRFWLLAVELDEARDERNRTEVSDLPSGTGEAHTFCREHRSWFCPCATPWIYEDKPWKARAWFEEDAEEAPAEPDEAPQGALTWAS